MGTSGFKKCKADIKKRVNSAFCFPWVLRQDLKTR